MNALTVPLAHAIVSGLTFATLLTLIATPAALAMPYRASMRNLAALAEQAKTVVRRTWANARRRWRRVDAGATVPLVVSAQGSRRGKKEPRR